MSLPSGHIAVGMLVPFIFSMIQYIKGKFRANRWILIWLPPVMIFCALWAVAPDMPRYIHERSYNWHIEHPILSNIFFFHGFLDTHETGDRGATWGASIILFIYSTLFIVYIRHINYCWKRLETARKRYKRDISVRLNSDIKKEHRDNKEI